jgi:hypothetical protein
LIKAAGRVEYTPESASNLTEEAKIILEEARVLVEVKAKEVFRNIEQPTDLEVELA